MARREYTEPFDRHWLAKENPDVLETIEQMRADLERQRPTAYCRLVETRGSTPQKAGAIMLVYEDGSQTGTLGGGCVEAEVKRHAIRIIGSGEPELVSFSLDHDYGWDDGLICGGRMTILIEPLAATDDSVAYYRQLTELGAAAGGFTEAIIFDSESSGKLAKLSAPACFLFDGEDLLAGCLHAQKETAKVVQQLLRPIASRPRSYAEGGIAFLPLAQRCKLVIVGGGHIGQAVAALAVDLDFEVCVTDDRESYVSEERFPHVEQRIAGPCKDVLPTLEITPDTYCLIVTRGHNHDQEALYYLANRGARYVGMIGSRRKIRMIFEDLIDEGIPQELLDKVYAPVGVDIGSQTVPEIAVSIAAELVAHRNLGDTVGDRSSNHLARSSQRTTGKQVSEGATS